MKSFFDLNRWKVGHVVIEFFPTEEVYESHSLPCITVCYIVMRSDTFRIERGH